MEEELVEKLLNHFRDFVFVQDPNEIDKAEAAQEMISQLSPEKFVELIQTFAVRMENRLFYNETLGDYDEL
jgi:hypothetical protein